MTLQEFKNKHNITESLRFYPSKSDNGRMVSGFAEDNTRSTIITTKEFDAAKPVFVTQVFETTDSETGEITTPDTPLYVFGNKAPKLAAFEL